MDDRPHLTVRIDWDRCALNNPDDRDESPNNPVNGLLQLMQAGAAPGEIARARHEVERWQTRQLRYAARRRERAQRPPRSSLQRRRLPAAPIVRRSARSARRARRAATRAAPSSDGSSGSDPPRHSLVLLGGVA